MSENLRLSPKTFISYRSLDAEIARTAGHLIALAGGEVYLDERDPELEVIRVGEAKRRSTMEIIDAGLRASDRLLAIITRRTRGSWWVPAEISAAFQMGKEVTLLCERGVRPPDFRVDFVINDRASLEKWLIARCGGVLLPGAVEALSKQLFSSKADNVRQGSANAIQKIEALWEPQTATKLMLEEPSYAHVGRWMGCRSEALIATLYAIAAPVYLYKRSAPRLDRSELEREIAAILYESWTDEESLASIPPRIIYEARKCTNWRSLRDQDPGRYWLQGMKAKDLDALFDEMTVGDQAPIGQEEFSELFLARYQQPGDGQKPLGLAANALQGFTLETRPVFARVLAVHLRVHCALLKLDDAGGVASIPLNQLFELPAPSRLSSTEVAEASLVYLLRKFGPRIREFCPPEVA